MADFSSIEERDQRLREFTRRAEQEFERLAERIREDWQRRIDEDLREILRRNAQRLRQEIQQRDRDRLEAMLLDALFGRQENGVRSRFGSSAGQALTETLRALTGSGRRNL